MHGAVLVAGGSSRRMEEQVKDKLLHPILDTTAFRMSFEAFYKSDKISCIIVVYRDSEQKLHLESECNTVLKKDNSHLALYFVQGGKERYNSVTNGLLALPKECSFIHVHDCARPLIKSTTIDQMAKEVESAGAIVACRPVVDTIRENIEPKLPFDYPKKTRTLNRTLLWKMETPQVCRKEWLEKGLMKAKEKNILITDEIATLELIGKKTAFHIPEYANPKITTIKDIRYIEFLLQK